MTVSTTNDNRIAITHGEETYYLTYGALGGNIRADHGFDIQNADGISLRLQKVDSLEGAAVIAALNANQLALQAHMGKVFDDRLQNIDGNANDAVSGWNINRIEAGIASNGLPSYEGSVHQIVDGLSASALCDSVAKLGIDTEVSGSGRMRGEKVLAGNIDGLTQDEIVTRLNQQIEGDKIMLANAGITVPTAEAVAEASTLLDSPAGALVDDFVAAAIYTEPFEFGVSPYFLTDGVDPNVVTVATEPADNSAVDDVIASLHASAIPDEIRDMQRALGRNPEYQARMGEGIARYDDGILGWRTEGVIEDYVREHGLDPDTMSIAQITQHALDNMDIMVADADTVSTEESSPEVNDYLSEPIQRITENFNLASTAPPESFDLNKLANSDAANDPNHDQFASVLLTLKV